MLNEQLLLPVCVGMTVAIVLSEKVPGSPGIVRLTRRLEQPKGLTPTGSDCANVIVPWTLPNFRSSFFAASIFTSCGFIAIAVSERDSVAMSACRILENLLF